MSATNFTNGNCMDAFQTMCSNCDTNADCSGATPYCDQTWKVCTECVNIYTGAYSDDRITGDTCGDSSFCNHTTYAIVIHRDYPPAGICTTIDYTPYTDSTGQMWAASKSGMSKWGAQSFCAKLGGRLATREDVCGGTTQEDCTNSTLFNELKGIFYTNGSPKRQNAWTREKGSTVANSYFFNFNTGALAQTGGTNSYYALCMTQNANCVATDETKPYWDSTSSSCVECAESNHCTAEKPSCDPEEHVCFECLPATQDVDCPPAVGAGTLCSAATPYYHVGVGCLACAPENCTAYKDSNGHIWVASNTTLSRANAITFCSGVGWGIELTTRMEMCGGTSQADCTASSVWAALKNYYYTNGSSHGGAQRTTVWTKDLFTSSSGYYVN